MTSLQPDWCHDLSLQQQSVLLLANRGPDGVAKNHPCKHLVRAYRACTLKAAALGREMHIEDSGDQFMDLRPMLFPPHWERIVNSYFETVDSLPHHYHLHLLHGAEILAYKHPDLYIRACWMGFYLRAVDDMHLTPESEEQMDQRLNDFGRADREEQAG